MFFKVVGNLALPKISRRNECFFVICFLFWRVTSYRLFICNFTYSVYLLTSSQVVFNSFLFSTLRFERAINRVLFLHNLLFNCFHCLCLRFLFLLFCYKLPGLLRSSSPTRQDGWCPRSLSQTQTTAEICRFFCSCYFTTF
uniref:(northern house mosquito) hypothetical protein n=1 Tax=Culex pipiens TaxID=7175 RepID=A0A8D8APV1_CULPI